MNYNRILFISHKIYSTNMKKIGFLAVSLVFTFSLFAQNGNGKFNERMQSQRIAFITQRLALTPEESQQFWPIYNQFTEKVQQIRSVKPDKPLVDMTEAEAEKGILEGFDKDARELDLKKEYYQKLKKVISVKKISRLYVAERDFKAELLQRLKENKQERKLLKQGGN
jgi:hypothetical protein